MNKTNFVKHMNALVKANETLDALFNAIGGDFDNGLTRLLDEIPKIYAEFYGINADSETYYANFWAMVNNGEAHDTNIDISNWEEFYDFFFVK